jgi:hypothetical protein
MSANKQRRREAIRRDPTSGMLLPSTPDEWAALGLPRPSHIWMPGVTVVDRAPLPKATARMRRR